MAIDFDVFGIPSTVLDGICVLPHDYTQACAIGSKCADDLVAELRAKPYLVGTSRIAAIADRLSQLEVHHGVAVGFFSRIERLLVEGSRAAQLRAETESYLKQFDSTGDLAK